MNSFHDEVNFIFSEQGGKYYIAAFVVVVGVLILFSVFFSNNYIKDGSVAVIDLDNSAYSRQLIAKFDASPYIGVHAVFNEMQDPEKLMYRDEYIAVIYLPEGLEKNRHRELPNQIGLFLDHTNSGLTGSLRSGLMEIIAVENIEIGFPRVKELGINDDQAIGILSNIQVNDRMLYNANDSPANTTIVAFLFMFPSITYAMMVLPIIARLRVSRQLSKELRDNNIWQVISRLLPYVGIYMTSIILGLGLLKTFTDFRFAGNVIQFILPLFLFSLSVGLMSMLLAWKAAHPGTAMGMMTFIIPPGFILGGATGPIAIFSDWVLVVAHCFPLTWIFKYVRAMGLRGASLTDLPYELLGQVVYVGVLVGLLYLRFNTEKRQILEEKDVKTPI